MERKTLHFSEIALTFSDLVIYFLLCTTACKYSPHCITLFFLPTTVYLQFVTSVCLFWVFLGVQATWSLVWAPWRAAGRAAAARRRGRWRRTRWCWTRWRCGTWCRTAPPSKRSSSASRGSCTRWALRSCWGGAKFGKSRRFVCFAERVWNVEPEWRVEVERSKF